MSHALVRLAHGLGCSHDLAAEVALAISDEASYRARFSTRLAERGPVPSRALPWIALIDALISAGRAVELDWREATSAVRGALRRLAVPLPKVRVPSTATAGEALGLFARAFESQSPDGSRLVLLDMQSDSAVVMLLPARELDALVALAAEAGQRIAPLPLAAPATPASAVPPLAPPPKTGPAWDKLLDGTDKWSRNTDGVLGRLLKNPSALDAIYAARDDAPADDHALIDAVAELYTATSPCAAVGAMAPDLALRALRYYHFGTPVAARAKLLATALVCERLYASADGFVAEDEAAARLAQSLVIWNEDAARQVLTLPETSRERLARAADALLRAVWQGRNPHVRREDHVYEMMKVVGDAATAYLIETQAPRVEGSLTSFVARQALEWIARRESAP